MTCPYCRKTMNAMGGLFIHLKIQPQAGDWDIETCPKLQLNDTPRDKWAKILQRMKGNMREVKLRERKYPQQLEEAIYTKVSDRDKGKRQEKEKRRRKMLEEERQEEAKRRTECENNNQEPNYKIITTVPETEGGNTNKATSEEETRNQPTTSAEAQEKTNIQTKKKRARKSGTRTNKKEATH